MEFNCLDVFKEPHKYFSASDSYFNWLSVLNSELDLLWVHHELSSSHVPALAGINPFLYLDNLYVRLPLLQYVFARVQTAFLLDYYKVWAITYFPIPEIYIEMQLSVKSALSQTQMTKS